MFKDTSSSLSNMNESDISHKFQDFVFWNVYKYMSGNKAGCAGIYQWIIFA